MPTDVVLVGRSNSLHGCFSLRRCLMPEGSSVRSPGSWQGGSWVSALLDDVFCWTPSQDLALWSCLAVFHEQDLLIRRHTSCCCLLEPLVSTFFAGFRGLFCLLLLFCLVCFLFCCWVFCVRFCPSFVLTRLRTVRTGKNRSICRRSATFDTLGSASRTSSLTH